MKTTQFYKLKSNEKILCFSTDVDIENYCDDYCTMYLTNLGLVFESKDSLYMPRRTIKTPDYEDDDEDEERDYLYFPLDELKVSGDGPRVRYDTRHHNPVLVIEFKNHPRFVCSFESDEASENLKNIIDSWVGFIQEACGLIPQQVVVDKKNDFLVCPMCGKKLRSELSFCTECGARLLNSPIDEDEVVEAVLEEKPSPTKESEPTLVEEKKEEPKETSPSKVSLSEQFELLEKLKELLDKNILTQEEYDKKKKEILGL